ncbi:MAG: HNH endonuclease [Actinomycetota bacterium]|nr:HNH endonuclease [Actinomycetota bacterium]MEC9316703.1 HNH endonuclease [Actinomycetota bacterium]
MESSPVMNKDRGPVLAERTLVLDVGFRPLSIVSVRRALLLVLADKAEVIHKSQRLVRSEKLQLSAPSVARLRYHVGAPYRRRASLHRKAVFARDDYLCQYCGRKAECIDHVYPRSKGGEHIWENVVACCRTCNVAKGDTLPEHSKFRLRGIPRAPEPIAVAAALRRGVPPEWDMYISNQLSLSA